MKYSLVYNLGDHSHTFVTERIYELEEFIEKLFIIKQTDSECLELNISEIKDIQEKGKEMK